MAETNSGRFGPTHGGAMSNNRIVSILFSLAIACALIALAWYQTHGGHMMLSISDAIAAVAMVFALVRFIPALIRCITKRNCATRSDKIG
jgi:membrane protein YdbS with pleckstrin-like domain